MTVTSVLAMAVKEGAEEAFVQAFRDLAVLDEARRSGGLVSGRLLRPLVPGRPFLVGAQWESAEAYERWLASPRRAELAAGLEPFLADEVSEGSLYADET